MRIVVGVLVAAILVVPFVLVGAGLWLLAQRQFGEKVQANVISCDIEVGYKTSQQTCLARWTQDGVEHEGSIQGSGDDEVGKTITATVRGDELYSRSLGLPLILLGLGLPLCFFPFAWLRSRLKRRSSESE